MRTGRIFKDPYSDEEIKVLVEEYEELDSLRSKSWIQVRLMDIDQAITHLPPAEKLAVLLNGKRGMLYSSAAKLAEVDTSTMFRRYWRGLLYLASYLNGGS